MSSKLAIAAAFLALADIFLGLCTLKLETFNRARIRRLRAHSRTLADQLEDMLPQLPRLRLTGHLMLVLSSGATALLLWHIIANYSGATQWIVPSAMLLAIFFGIEILDLALPLTATAKMLCIAGALGKLLRWPLLPLVFPLELGHRYRQLQSHTGKTPHSQVVTAEDEILSLVQDAPEDSVTESAATPVDDLEQDEKRMLNGVMNLDKTLVHEIMTPRVDIDAISEGCSIDEARRAIAKSGHSRIPVFATSIDSISGILYAKDLLDPDLLEKKRTVKELCHQPVFIPETKNVGVLLDEFRRNRIHIAVVLDEYGGTSGLVTIEDILEEIVGEIQDEYDHDEVPASQASEAADGTMEVDSRMSIWELNQLLDLEISEEEDYDTLGGYIMAKLGRIPRSGERFTTDGLEVEIISATPRCLDTLRIRKIDGEKDTAEEEESRQN